jgi:hypothetical protein
MKSFIFSAAAAAVIICAGTLFAAQRPPADIVITSDEIAKAPGGDSRQGDYFTLDSTQEDVVRVQGEPDSKFFDGRYFIWYYGKDDVYIDFYGRVVGADNNSGNLKFR